MERIISAKSISKEIGGTTILKDISFDVSKNERIAILGANGAGKSTLLNIISGVYGVNHGEIYIPNGLKKAMIFQKSILDKELTVFENLKHRLGDKKEFKRAINLIKKSDVLNDPSQLYGSLSGGQKRAVDVIRVIAMNPNLLLMDEATTGMDVEARKDFWNNVNKYCNNKNNSLIYTTHYREEIRYATRIIFLNKGQIIFDGSSEDFISKIPKVKVYIEKPDLTEDSLIFSENGFKNDEDCYTQTFTSSNLALDKLNYLRQMGCNFEFRVEEATLNDFFSIILNGRTD
ncbi:MAG: ABC transporter ATP-binding protein [Lactobacillaceae bacterium]|jgi:multidrug/hemolysin transport system ATP-binding protein|nr:ABC transporter ATP-binding protein [Lactobacillaceae bacterium]